MKKHYDYVFVILVYRNVDDLVSCLESVAEKNYKLSGGNS